MLNFLYLFWRKLPLTLTLTFIMTKACVTTHAQKKQKKGCASVAWVQISVIDFVFMNHKQEVC